MERGRIDPVALIAGDNASTRDDTLPDVMAALGPVLDQWQRAGLIQQTHRFFDLSVAGRFWQVQMTKRLTEFLNTTYLPADIAVSKANGPNGAAKPVKSNGDSQHAA